MHFTKIICLAQRQTQLKLVIIGLNLYIAPIYLGSISIFLFTICACSLKQDGFLANPSEYSLETKLLKIDLDIAIKLPYICFIQFWDLSPLYP